MLKSQEGFTLVELMIVVVILGILAGIGIQQYGNVQERARKVAHEANVKIIRSAANMYLMLEKIEVGNNNQVEVEIEDLVAKGYLDSVPKNPETDQPYEIQIYFRGENGDGVYSVHVGGNGTDWDPEIPSNDD